MRKLDRLVTEIRALTIRELVELNRRLGGDLGGSAGVREPRRPTPQAPVIADSEDRSVKGRTLQ